MLEAENDDVLVELPLLVVNGEIVPLAEAVAELLSLADAEGVGVDPGVVVGVELEDALEEVVGVEDSELEDETLEEGEALNEVDSVEEPEALGVLLLEAELDCVAVDDTLPEGEVEVVLAVEDVAVGEAEGVAVGGAVLLALDEEELAEEVDSRPVEELVLVLELEPEEVPLAEDEEVREPDLE